MIREDEIIGVLIDFGLSPIEANRTTDSVDNFRSAIRDIIEKMYDNDFIVEKEAIRKADD